MARGRFLIAIIMSIVAVASYFGSREFNPVTGETQYVGITAEQEIALGIQAAPQLAQQHGGLHPDSRAQALVDSIGQRIVSRTAASDTPYKFEFHLLGDDAAINAFALPGGQIFITSGLLNKLETEGEVAAVLGHEIGHVVARHGAEHIAKAKLTEGLTGAAVIASYDPSNPSSQQTAAMVALVGQLVNMKFGRDDELESDRLGVRFAAEAGYDPRSMIRVMEALAEAGRGGQSPPEFFSTHPNPDNRIQRIKAAIEEIFPVGAPEGLAR